MRKSPLSKQETKVASLKKFPLGIVKETTFDAFGKAIYTGCKRDPETPIYLEFLKKEARLP